MYVFGKKSLKQLGTIHKDLQLILNELIKYYDFSVLEGLRSTERQQQLFALNRSKLDGIDRKSKHQDNGSGVSYAVDIMPYKKGSNAFDNNEYEARRFYFMMGQVRIISEKLLESGKISHKIRFGLDWDSDDVFTDQTFHDLPHMELIPI